MVDRVKPTFKIIEESDNFDYKGFTKDYMDLDNSKDDLMRKYGLSNGQYYNRVKTVKSDTGFSRKRLIKNPDMLYISRDRNKYRVQKRRKYCGLYPDLKTAQLCRNIMIEHDWDENIIRNCIKTYASDNRGIFNHNSPLTKKALSRFNEFKRLWDSDKYTGVEIRDKMGFTEHQYRVCREKMKEINPVRKTLVRSYDRVM